MDQDRPEGQEGVPLMARTKKADPAVMAATLIGRYGYELEAIRMIGEDDWNHCVHYLILGKKPDSVWQDAQFATWVMVDWTHHPEKGDRDRGAELYYGHYQIENGMAMREFEERYRSKLEGSYWVFPGTDRPIPGCGGWL